MNKSIASLAPTPVTQDVRIELPYRHVPALRRILDKIGGEPRLTRRGLIDDIAVALSAIGIESADITTEEVSGSIYFKELY